jgi:predicted permease
MRHRLSNGLVIGEVSVSVILLAGAGLLLATFMNLRGIPIGFDTNNLVTVQLPLSPAKYGSKTAVSQLDRTLIDRISAIPGVASVTTASSIPLERGPNFIFGILGEPAEKIHYVELRPVGPDYFRTLSIPLRAGRSLSASDTENSLPVVVVNETLANLFGGPANALGRSIVLGRTTGNEDVPREIVGVVSNVADGRPGTRRFPTLYLARNQLGAVTSMSAVLIRTSGRVEIARDLRRIIHAIDSQLPVTSIRPMSEVASTALAQQRFNMMLMGVFAAVALLLAMVGLYGLLSYQVAQRTREIGVRMALGASGADLLRMVVMRGLILTSIGLVIGVAASLGLAGFVKTMLYGVTPTSPWVFAAVAGLLTAVAFIASFIPARRAMSVEPVIALRYE